MKLNRLALCIATVAGLGAALPAAAQFRKPEDAVKYRQSVMSIQGFHLGRIFGMANGRVPFDAKVAGEDAEILAAVNRYAFIGFVDGSDKGNTNAKPEVWSNRAKFDAAAKKATEEVAKLNVAAKTGNIDQIKAAAGAVGGACKACHDDFQKQ